MKPHSLMFALCLSVITTRARSASLENRHDHNIVVASSHPKERRSVEDSSPKPYEPIQLSEMRVRSEIALRYARTSVVTRVRNPDARAQETTFRMLLPDTAFISNFTMTLGGKMYKAYVKGKQEAKQIYTQAVSQGSSAAHIGVKARDSNHFTVTVNVEGNSTAVFDLRYEDFLVSRDEMYRHAINLHPGALVPVLEVVVHIKESQRITKLRVPELRTGNEVDASQTDTQNSMAVIQNGTSEREVTITFTPNLSEQRRLAEIYAAKSRDSTDAVLGQFVVEYDVERSNNGEILVNDGYFVHFLAPPSLPPLSKHVVFVLDTSGSMSGRKIEQLRKAMDAILSDLNHNDYFSIVEFGHFVTVHELDEADKPAPHREYWYYNTIDNDEPYTLVAPAPASPENIAKAKIIASRLDYTGGTNIYRALDAAANLVKLGVDDEKEPGKKKNLEAIILFLTDGEPEDGETNTDRIITLITEKNSGDSRAAIYSIAFGDDADRVFLRKLSLRNEGFMRHIYEAADAALQLRDFYRQVASPLLSHVQFLYPANQIKERSVSRNQFRTINVGAEVAVVGQVAEDVSEITPRVVGFCGSGDGLNSQPYEVSSKVAVSRDKDSYLPLERLWAYLTIKQLLDKRDAADDRGDDENSAEEKALAIALKYGFVTPLTSLVVVKPNESNAVDMESVDKTTHTTTPQPTTTPEPPAVVPLVYYYRPRAAIASGRSMHFTSSYDDLIPHVGVQTYGNSGYSGFQRKNLAFNTFSDYSDLESQLIDTQPRHFSQSNVHFGSFGAGATTAVTVPSIAASSTTTTRALYTTTAAPIGDYHLDEFVWAASLLNTTAGALVVFGENGTRVTLELTRDINPPKAEGGDEECSSGSPAVGAASPAGGVCVYLTRCAAARHIAAEDYAKSYCVVNDRYAGVCCPRDEVDNSS